jgi:CubicO group peptidase (beta-lactamase class C family)
MPAWENLASKFYAAEMTIDQKAMMALLARARREVDDGLLPSSQVALAYNREIVAFESYGDATNDTRYAVFSCTKAFVAGAVWALIGDGLIDVSLPVSHYIPEFAANDKGAITVEQVMLHTAGFPHAPMPIPIGATSEGRTARFAAWRLNWEPGSSYEYHATSAHWVLAEIIERVTGKDFRDIVETRITAPAGLPKLLALAETEQQNIATLKLVGSPATTEEIRSVFGVDQLPVTEVTPDALLAFNDPVSRAVGVPGGGGCMRACDLALYYQRMLHDQGTIWKPEVLKNVTSVVRNSLPERHTGIPANRSLGLVLAGNDGNNFARGFGRTVSAGAFGHNGAAGQIAWADPATGLSLGYCTNGVDINVIREPRRGTAISSLAAICAK